MMIIYQLFLIRLMILIKPILTAPRADSTKLSPRDTFDSLPPLISEDDSGSWDLFYFSRTQDACLSSQTEFFISSTELDFCPGGGTKLPGGATPSPPANLELPDLLNVFGIGGEDEQSPDAVEKMTWEGEDLNSCRGRNPYRLHVCCSGELGYFDGVELYSIKDCVIRTYCTAAFFSRIGRTGLSWRIYLVGVCYSFSYAPLFHGT